MSTRVKKLENLLEETKIGFGNALVNPEIKLMVAELGFVEPRLVSLTKMTGLLNDKYQYQQKVIGEQIIATSNLDELVEAEIKYLRDMRGTAKKAVRGPKYERYSRLLGLGRRIQFVA